jgi:hypothetical protein
MYAQCPECGDVVYDHGRGGKLQCRGCGTRFSSRPVPGHFRDPEGQREMGAAGGDRESEKYRYFEYSEPLRESDKSKMSEKGARVRTSVPPPPPGPRPPPVPYGIPPYPPAQPQDSFISDIRHFFRVIIAFLVLVGFICFFVLYTLSLIALGPALVVVLPNLMDSSPAVLIPTITPPFIAVLGRIPEGYIAVGYFIFIVSSIFMSVYWLIYTEGRQAWYQFKNNNNKLLTPPFKSSNSFFLLPQVFLALLFFNALVVFLFLLYGIEPTVPESLSGDTPLWVLMYGLANASVWEELSTRVLFLGLPLAFFEILRRMSNRGTGTEMRRFILGGKMKIGSLELFFILFSATVFGLAHISGWDYWKFFPTFLSGAAFGYLFIVKGLHVAILLHFAFDYLTIPLELFNPGLAGQALYVLAIALLIFLGLIFFISFTFRLGSHAIEALRSRANE